MANAVVLVRKKWCGGGAIRRFNVAKLTNAAPNL